MRFLGPGDKGFMLSGLIWEFPKVRGASFWGPYDKNPTI